MAKTKFSTGGVAALLRNASQLEKAIQENPHEVVRELATNVIMLPIDYVEANREQPRRDFDERAMEELASSIKVHGIIQPITVRRMHDKAYQIISGERRYRAGKLAGLAEIPAYVRLANDQELLEMALIENIQREDLNAMEVAISYSRLAADYKLTHDQIAGRVGKERSTVTNYLRLVNLPQYVTDAIRDRKISMGHARALAAVDDISLQNALCRQIIEEDLSVRAVEKIISGYNEDRKGKISKADKRLPDHLRNIQDQFSAFFGTKVALKRSESGKGQLVVNFGTDAELNRLIDAIEKQ